MPRPVIAWSLVSVSLSLSSLAVTAWAVPRNIARCNALGLVLNGIAFAGSTLALAIVLALWLTRRP